MPDTKVTVCIRGKTYTLLSDQPAEYIQTIAQIVDRKFEDAFLEDDELSLFDASVLVSMEVIDENIRTDKNATTIRTQVKAYYEEAMRLRQELEETKKQLKKTQGELKAEQERAGKLRVERDMLALRDRLDHKPEHKAGEQVKLQ